MRVLIVDDEPHARHYLAELLATEHGCELSGEAGDAEGALEMIRRCQPELVLLDIQMPRLNGLEVVQVLDRAWLPLYIFVTGYSEYAAGAFEIDAVDYLVKPFDKERFATALDRVRRRLDAQTRAPSHIGGSGPSVCFSRIAIKDGGGTLFVATEDILWIEAANRYVVIHTADTTHVARLTIQGLEDTLDPAQFVRIHRSALVRKAAVRGLRPLLHGDYLVRLVNGEEVTLSRSFRHTFFTAMGR